ncbi:extracellular calcium-sensing receptor-like [Protopterus annectens]|uniref:extracellular calcium-sensing receptor-like n=1 Tax=Protopterus annectens TaxID=7888 RepID=UPI001CFBA61A|nr:extracellular calcium-sensing receptor-like [Protopterus annectens]
MHVNLYGAFFSSFSFRSYRWIQSMLFAIHRINQNLTLLPNVTLAFRIYDTCLDMARTMWGTMWLLTGQNEMPIPNYNCDHHFSVVATIGDSTSSRSIQMAHLLGLYLHPQISYFASSPLLNDRHRYPSFYRTIPSDEFQAHGLAQLVIYFGWTWVGLLAEDDEYGKEGTKTLKEELIKAGGCVAFDETIPLLYSEKETKLIVDMIQKSSSSAIVVFCFDFQMIPIMQEILRQNISGKVWIASEAWSTSSVLSQAKYTNLLSGTLGFAIRRRQIPGFRQFLLRINPMSNPDDIFVKPFWEAAFGCSWIIPDSNETTGLSDIIAKLCTGSERLETLSNAYTDVSNLRITYNVYNAVYAVACALHDLSVCNPGEGPFYNGTCASIHNYEPWQVLHYLSHIHFVNDASEEVYFDKNGNILALYDVLNWQKSSDSTTEFTKVGSYNAREFISQKLVINSSAIMWAGGLDKAPRSVCSENCPTGHRKATKQGQPACCFDCIPCSQGEFANHTDSAECKKCPDDHWTNDRRDRCLPKTTDFLSYQDPLGGTIAFVSIFFSLLPAAVLIIFIKYRDTPIIKASNQELSCLLLLGLVFCFLCSLIFIGQPVTITCALRQVTFGVMFALCISCILAKTILVVIAFSATKPKSNLKKYIGPILPKATVVLFTFLQAVIGITWIARAPPTVEYDMKFQTGKIIIQCNEGSPTAFWCMLGYMGLLAIVSLIVAFLARQLPDNFNEAKYITFGMLVFVSVWFSFIPAYLTTRGKYMVAVELFAILSSSAGLLVCIFFPKCYIILLRPKRNTREHFKGKKTIGFQ